LSTLSVSHTSPPITVSIVIPCHNAEAWLAQTIESALNQVGIGSPEVIVIENGSTDKSLQIAGRYRHRIKLIETKAPLANGNVARNLGLEQATGDWIQFLDADDYLKPDKIASNLQAASSVSDCDAVYSPVIEETCRTGEVTDQHTTDYSDSEDIYLRWIRWKLCQTGGVLWRRQSLQKIGGWNADFSHCQDNEVCLRALHNMLSFAFDPHPRAVYRIYGEQTVSRKNPNTVSHTKSELQLEMLRWLESQDRATTAHRQAVGQALFENARMVARTHIDTAAQLLRRCRTECKLVLRGPAAPLSYRLSFRFLGFANAERLARLRRLKNYGAARSKE
jgi:glycosyltransferase involved in cell wall biosynthesis